MTKLWDYNQPPVWFPTAVMTNRGWENPDTGEVLVAIGLGNTIGGAGDVLSLVFDQAEYAKGDPIEVTIRFNERVDVTAGATITITSTQPSGDFTLTAAAQTAQNEVVFTGTVPEEAGTLSIEAQNITGTIVDTGTSTNTNKAISAAQATAAGTRVIPNAEVVSIEFGSESYAVTDDLTVIVTFSESVDVTAGASLVVTWSGASGDVTLYADAQTGTEITFDLEVDLTTSATVPNEAGVLSLEAQTITGTIADTLGGVASDLDVSAAQATAAGLREVE